MEKLTDYQNKNFQAAAYITLEGIKYNAEIKKCENILSISFKEPKSLGNFIFTVSGNAVSLKVGALSVPLDAGEGLWRISRLSSLFSVPAAGTWKITKEKLGGVAVYVCRNESSGLLMYINAGSRLPLKIKHAGIEADIISFVQ